MKILNLLIKNFKNNQGTAKLLLLVFIFLVLKEPIDTLIVKYLSNLNLIYFSIIYFFLTLLFLPTLPMTLIAASLYSPLKASIFMSITVTLVALIQVKFPKSLGLGIRDDKYISYLVKNMSLKTLVDKFYLFVIARFIPLVPLAVTSALSMKILNPKSNINLFIFLAATFLGTLTITFSVIKVVTI